MPAIPPKVKTWIKRFILALPVFITLLLLFYIFVVPAITGWAIDRALKAAGLTGAHYELRSVSLYSLNIADVRISPQDPSVVGAIAIDYTPWTLIEGRVRSVRLIGAQLEVKLINGKLDFGGLAPIISPEPETGEVKKGPGVDQDLSILPVDQIQLESGSLILDINGWKFRLNATGTIKKVGTPPSALFDEPVTRKIDQYLAIDFRIDSAMVPLHLIGWVAPDLDDADLSFHFGPRHEGHVAMDGHATGARPTAGLAEAGKQAKPSVNERATSSRPSPPFLRANISAREQSDGSHYRVKVRAESGTSKAASNQAGAENFAGLEFDSRFNNDFSLKSLNGSAQAIKLAIGPITIDSQTLIGVRDGRAALDSSQISISGPAGWAGDATMAITGLTAGFPASANSADRNITLGFDFASGFTSRIKMPGFLSSLFGPVMQMGFQTHGSASASVDTSNGKTRAQVKIDRLLVTQNAADDSGWLGRVGLSAQGMSLSRDDTKLEARLQSARLWFTRSREQTITGDLAVRVPYEIPEGTLLLEVGNPGAGDIDGLFWEQQLDDKARQKLVLGRAVLRARGAMQTTLPGSGTHRVDARIRLPLSLSIGVYQGVKDHVAIEGPVLVIPVARESGDTPAVQAVQTLSSSNAATRGFLPEDRPRMQWQIDSSFLGLPGATAEDCRWVGALEVKGQSPVVIHFPPTKAQMAQASAGAESSGSTTAPATQEALPEPSGYLRLVRIEPTRLRIVASARSDARIRGSADLAGGSLSRIALSAPPELEIVVSPRTDRATLEQTDFSVGLTVPSFDLRLSANDSLRVSGQVKAGITPRQLAQGVSMLITPEVDVNLDSVRLKTYGIESFSGRVGWSSSRINVDPDGLEIQGRLTLKNLNIDLPKYDFRLKDGSIEIPVMTRQVDDAWSWPTENSSKSANSLTAEKTAPGVISLPTLTYLNEPLAPITGEASFVGSRFNSRLGWEPLEGAKLSIVSHVDVLPELSAQLKIDLPLFAPQNSFAIGQLVGTLGINRLQRVEISGKLGASATITYADGKPNGTAKVNVDRLNIIDRLSAIDINGLTGQLNFAELFPLRSEGGQKLSAWGIRINDIGLAAPEMIVTIEGPKTILIERTRANIGTDGILGLTAFRLRSDKADINTDLLVENVNISDLFAAFAKEKLRGDGGLWGRVPIIISIGSPEPLIIREGFLFARPGDTGWFEILDESTNGTIDAIAESVAVDESYGKQQFDDIRAGIRGLKNFSYDKLTVNFEKRNNKTLAVIRASGKARGAGPMIPPLVPTITIENIDHALGTALNYWYQWTRPGASAPPAPSPLDELF